jgi:hypothetical protein
MKLEFSVGGKAMSRVLIFGTVKDQGVEATQ